ncbi:rhomboid-related protein 2 [Ixodes scapularis]|uniref:rhomboid-related protein 2 n=1 Tax=Ixodes scapularis TaxID=6945 RepID=UPI001C390848|nr:rhomboid-related protein 2 [Ixodes scapularis]
MADNSQTSRKLHRGVSTKSETEVVELERLWRSVFEKYDHDDDGQIPLDEILQLLHEHNQELEHDMPPSVLQEIVERADWDSNRMLSFEEFTRMVHAHELGEHRPRFQRLVHYAAMAVVPSRQRATVVRKYLDEYSCKPPPMFILLISLLEVATFIYYCVVLHEFSATGPVPMDSVFIYNPKRRKEAWRYLTYMLTHAGAYHIFFNLLIQLLLGVPLEMVHKWWRVLLVYIAGVVAGSLGSSVSDPKVFLAGASGGVYALIAAHLATVILNFKEMDMAWIRLFCLVAFAGTDVGVAVYTRYTEGDEGHKVSYAAHIAGALAGLLVGVTFLRNLVVHRWEVALGRAFLALFLLLVLAAVLFNALYGEYFPPSVI